MDKDHKENIAKDIEETIVREFKDESYDTTDTWLRYAGYTARLKTILLSTKRYLAYTSDLGEAFRPIVQKVVVNGAYAISWTYIAYDVSIEGYHAHLEGKSKGEVGTVIAKRAVFQSLASMALPAFTIHSTVNAFSYMCKRIGKYQRWGPTVAGLAVVPALPFLFDHPIEYAVDTAFDKIFEAAGIHTEDSNKKVD